MNPYTLAPASLLYPSKFLLVMLFYLIEVNKTFFSISTVPIVFNLYLNGLWALHYSFYFSFKVLLKKNYVF